MQIIRDKESFEEPLWVCFCGDYMYMAPSLPGLLWQMVTQWRHRKHFVGL